MDEGVEDGEYVDVIANKNVGIGLYCGRDGIAYC
jgi:hypothetical protein